MGVGKMGGELEGGKVEEESPSPCQRLAAPGWLALRRDIRYRMCVDKGRPGVRIAGGQ